ncbi:MAG: hypothetical protein EAS52_19800 [Parapedobacter sp.]|nr:MAG: hypothetical protein EAS52_19800 [Parapedobacter sp.]
MPANPKYLSKPGQRFLKITAAIIGGYGVATAVHLLVASFLPIREYAILISSFTFFLLWGVLIMLTFLARSGWRIWGIYLLIIGILSAAIYVINLAS